MLLHLDVILVILLLKVTFFSFQNQLCFLCFSKTFSNNLSRNIKCVCFLCDQMPKWLLLNIHKEYAHVILLLKNFLDCF